MPYTKRYRSGIKKIFYPSGVKTIFPSGMTKWAPKRRRGGYRRRHY